MFCFQDWFSIRSRLLPMTTPSSSLAFLRFQVLFKDLLEDGEFYWFENLIFIRWMIWHWASLKGKRRRCNIEGLAFLQNRKSTIFNFEALIHLKLVLIMRLSCWMHNKSSFSEECLLNIILILKLFNPALRATNLKIFRAGANDLIHSRIELEN